MKTQHRFRVLCLTALLAPGVLSVCLADSEDLADALREAATACPGGANAVYADIDENGVDETFVVFTTIDGEAFGEPQGYFFSGIDAHCGGAAPWPRGKIAISFVDATEPGFDETDPDTWVYKGVSGVGLIIFSDSCVAHGDWDHAYRSVNAYTEREQGGDLVDSFQYRAVHPDPDPQVCEFDSAAGIKEIYIDSDFCENAISSFVITSVSLPAAAVIDDPIAKFVGPWTFSRNVPWFFGKGYWHDQNSGKGNKSGYFTPNLPFSGDYRVYLWYPDALDRATSVPVDIVHEGITTTVKVNQRLNGGAWSLLGTFRFSAGTGGFVRIRNDGTVGYVIADAVKFEPVRKMTVDDPKAAYVGSWRASTSWPGYYGPGYRHDGNTGKGSMSATFRSDFPYPGTYSVFIWYSAAANRASNVPVDVVHQGGMNTLKVDQRVNGGKWNSLGTYQFGAGTDGYVRIRNTGTAGYVVADAVRFVEVTSIVVDDPMASYSGTWSTSTTSPGYFGSGYRHDQNSGKGTKSATFSPTLPGAGNYSVFMWYPAAQNRANNVPVDILHGGVTSTVTLNQTVDGGKWNLLGTFYFAKGTGGLVRIRNTATTGYVVADAVRWVIAPWETQQSEPLVFEPGSVGSGSEWPPDAE